MPSCCILQLSPLKLRPKSTVAVVSVWSITDFIMVDFDKFGKLLRSCEVTDGPLVDAMVLANSWP